LCGKKNYFQKYTSLKCKAKGDLVKYCLKSYIQEEPGGGDDIPLDTELLARSPQLTGLVRRELVPALRDLLHHGLGQVQRSHTEIY